MVATDWRKATVSVVMVRTEPLPCTQGAWTRSVASALQQDPPVRELIIVDNRKGAAVPEGLPRSTTRVVLLPGGYDSRAAMLNAGILAASGEFIALVQNDEAAVHLRRSAIQSMLISAVRQSRAAMVYSDYKLVDGDEATPQHLLDHHAGRLRETTDYGRVWLLDTRTLRTIGSLDTQYRWADLYDLRLRLSELCTVVHVADKCDGALYSVAGPKRPHNVFDYLEDHRPAQVEYERALTQHLKRIGAYLKPNVLAEETACAEDKPGDADRCAASVVIPVFRRPEFIGTAIQSAQNQTVQDCEVIVVVNGGDDDPTAEQVRRYMADGDRHAEEKPPVRLIVVDVNNIGYCLNVGVAAARGKVYIQLDSDDRLKPEAIEKLLAVFASDPTIGAVIGSYEVWDLDSAGDRIENTADLRVITHAEWTDDNGLNNLLRVNGAGAPRAAYVNVIRQVGWFGMNDTPHSRNYGEDYDLILRISERYRIGRVWDPIYEVVRHPGGTDHAIDQDTIDRNNNAKDHMRLMAICRRQKLRGLHGLVEPEGGWRTAEQDRHVSDATERSNGATE